MHYSNVVSAWIVEAADRLAMEAERLQLDLRDVAALTLIAAHDDCTMDWLEPRVGLSQSGTVRLVDRLEGKSFVRRERRGRAVALSVTAGGESRLKAWSSARDAAVDELLSGLDADERKALTESLAGSLAARPRPRLAADRACRTCLWPACGDDCPVDQSVQAL